MLGYVRKNGVGATEGNKGRFAEKEAERDEQALGTEPQNREQDGRDPKQ